jgi:GNAT superfamily N-acetyltransferase
MGSSLIIRPGRVQDVAQMARVHVRCWQETYRGLMPDAVLDDPGFPAARERMWTQVLTCERYRQNRVAVAERDEELAGIAMSGPPEDVTAAWARQLYVLYVYAAGHGTGIGRALLEAVIPTLARRRSTASTASFPTGPPGPRTACGRSAWSATCSTAPLWIRPGRLGSLVLAGAPAALRAAAARARGGGEDKGRWFALSGKISHR